MTSFVYTTGTPSNVHGPTTASMADIKNSFADIKAFINGGLTTTQFGTLTDSRLVDSGLGAWRTLLRMESVVQASVTAAAPVITNQNSQQFSSLPSTNNSAVNPGLWTPPTLTDLNKTGKTVTVRTKVFAAPNSTSSGSTFTFGLYPVTVTTGGANGPRWTVGSVVSGTLASVAPGGSVAQAVSSGASLSLFTAGTQYFVASTYTTTAASSMTAFVVVVEMKYS